MSIKELLDREVNCLEKYERHEIDDSCTSYITIYDDRFEKYCIFQYAGLTEIECGDSSKLNRNILADYIKIK